MDRTPLQTPRLRLRPREAGDIEDFLAMDADPEVVRYIYPEGPPEPAALRERYRARILAGWPQAGGFWIVEWRERPGFLG